MADTPTQRIAGLETKQAVTNTRVDVLEEAVSEVRSITTGHTPEIAALRAEVKQLQSDRDDLRGQLNGLKTQLLAAAIAVILSLVGVIVTVTIALVNASKKLP